METFFLVSDTSSHYHLKTDYTPQSETLKYLYLLFSNSTVLPLDEYVFNTEVRTESPVSMDYSDSSNTRRILSQFSSPLFVFKAISPFQYLCAISSAFIHSFSESCPHPSRNFRCTVALNARYLFNTLTAVWFKHWPYHIVNRSVRLSGLPSTLLIRRR